MRYCTHSWLEMGDMQIKIMFTVISKYLTMQSNKTGLLIQRAGRPE